LVTVTSRAVVGAFDAIEMLATTSVDETKVVELRVIPVPEKEIVAPFEKPEPCTVTFWFVAPCPSELGVVDVTAGPGTTVKHPLHFAF
jgi:hypothetical protein